MDAELTTRRLVSMILAAGLILVGFLGMWWTVHLPDYDQYGIQIGCGSGFLGDLSHAERAGGSAAGQCDSALLIRRLWSIPLMIVGAATLVLLALRGTRVVQTR